MIQDTLVLPLLPVGQRLVSDRQTVKAKTMVRINLACGCRHNQSAVII